MLSRAGDAPPVLRLPMEGLSALVCFRFVHCGDKGVVCYSGHHYLAHSSMCALQASNFENFCSRVKALCTVVAFTISTSFTNVASHEFVGKHLDKKTNCSRLKVLQNMSSLSGSTATQLLAAAKWSAAADIPIHFYTLWVDMVMCVFL